MAGSIRLRRSLATAFLGSALVGLGFRPANSQVTAADTAAVLLNTAQRMHQDDDRPLAQAILRLIIRTYPGSPAAADARARLAEWRRAADATSGRVELIVWGTTYGAWMGIALPLAAGAETPEPYGAGLLLGTPVGFFGARAYGQAFPISLGQARVIRFASMWGSWQGVGWQQALNLGNPTQRYCDPYYGGGCYEYPVESDLAPVTFSLMGSLVGLGTGIALAQSVNISPGTAAMVEFSGYWATWYGAATGVLFDWEGDGLLSWILLTGDAGVLAASLIAPKLDLSVGRARLISITGLAGLVAGLGLDLIMSVENEKVAIAIPMVTSFAGLGLGASWTRNYDARDRDDLPGGNALLQVRDGRPRLGVPTPLPAALPTSFDGSRVRHTPGVKLTLVQATF
ncbi:MAG: hypothetical protein HYW06_10550 [Gemmatimonadetes bacterium]|nr:hypothetical protein [Gemmatimonadota bacterium]